MILTGLILISQKQRKFHVLTGFTAEIIAKSNEPTTQMN